MKTLEYHLTDKSTWCDGPWMSEPDKRQWQDEDSGYPCLIQRNPLGALCGYVGVPRGHPAYGQSWERVDEVIRIHGGLTFADYFSRQAGGIYHEVEPGDPEDIYWFGFNCGHMGDRSPRLELHIIAPLATVAVPSTYRDMNYVAQECRRLALQLLALERKPSPETA